jgi:hypothetical protein
VMDAIEADKLDKADSASSGRTRVPITAGSHDFSPRPRWHRS